MCRNTKSQQNGERCQKRRRWGLFETENYRYQNTEFKKDQYIKNLYTHIDWKRQYEQ